MLTKPNPNNNLNLKPNPIYALYGSHFNKWVSAQKIGS